MSYRDQPLGELALSIPRASALFRKYDMDYCCGGKQTLARAAARKELDLDVIEAQLAQLAEQLAGGFELFAGAVETAQAQGHAMLAQGPDRGGFGDLNAFAIRQYRDKTQVRRAEGLADLDLEFGGAFLARLQ